MDVFLKWEEFRHFFYLFIEGLGFLSCYDNYSNIEFAKACLTFFPTKCFPWIKEVFFIFVNIIKSREY